MKKSKLKVVLIVLLCCLVCVPIVVGCTRLVNSDGKQDEPIVDNENNENVENETGTGTTENENDNLTDDETEKVSTVEMITADDGTITIKGKNGTDKEVVFSVFAGTLEAGRYEFVTGLEESNDYYFAVGHGADFESSELMSADSFTIDTTGDYSIYAVVSSGAEVDISFKPTLNYITNFMLLQNAVATASADEHITFGYDVVFTEALTVDKNISIDLYGTNESTSFALENGAKLTVAGLFNGVTISGSGTLVLNNVSSKATATGTNGLTIAENSEIILEIVDTCVITGAIGGDGIEIPETSELTITGDNLTVKGNNGNEYSTLTGYGTTDDTAYNGKFGSGIGNAQKNIGKIHITNLNYLVAEGYGQKAFGIGGGDGSTITIDNTSIKYVRGGFANNVFTTGNLYGKTEAEGGCAIGVGSGASVNYTEGSIVLDNVIIDKAEGGGKSAGIGALYWNGVNIEIKNSTLRNIIGGNCSAGIGGARVNKALPSDQEINIIIADSTVTATGGEYGAGIGSGYNTYCSQDFQVVNIEITGNSYITATGGKNGAGIGTGHHNAGLTGFIDSSVVVNATAGETYVYETGNISAPQAIGYGMCYIDVEREFYNVTVTFTVAGEVITHPYENLVSTATE
ncbi:MAG: hypothetical protein IJ039_04520 [Clostridia bacterium]|nr:hypothetical protein [Clostridia bacterium]